MTPEQIEARKAKARLRAAEWRKKNHERALEAVRQWRKKNRERAAQLTREWYLKNRKRCYENSSRWYRQNADEVKSAARMWVQSNRERRRELARNWAASRPKGSQYNIRATLSNRIRMALRGLKKAKKTEALIGCSVAHFKSYIESQFLPGMTWENHGEWHIDHIRPCRAFNLADHSEQLRCFHFSNLRPLWAKDNLIKGDLISMGGKIVRARSLVGVL